MAFLPRCSWLQFTAFSECPVMDVAFYCIFCLSSDGCHFVAFSDCPVMDVAKQPNKQHKTKTNTKKTYIQAKKHIQANTNQNLNKNNHKHNKHLQATKQATNKSQNTNKTNTYIQARNISKQSKQQTNNNKIHLQSTQIYRQQKNTPTHRGKQILHGVLLLP